MKLKTSLTAIAAASVLLFVSAPVFASPFHHVHVPAHRLIVDNAQINLGGNTATTTFAGIQLAGDDASVSSAAIGNNLGVNISSVHTGVSLYNRQLSVGQMTATTTSYGIQAAGDDASVSSAAIGNSVGVTIGGLDL